MTQKNNGGPAFPSDMLINGSFNGSTYSGMSLRQYAAIKLRVPDSGTDWLDAMILQSKRDEFAGQALEGRAYDGWGAEDIAEMAYEVADAMIEAELQRKHSNKETNQ